MRALPQRLSGAQRYIDHLRENKGRRPAIITKLSTKRLTTIGALTIARLLRFGIGIWGAAGAPVIRPRRAASGTTQWRKLPGAFPKTFIHVSGARKDSHNGSIPFPRTAPALQHFIASRHETGRSMPDAGRRLSYRTRDVHSSTRHSLQRTRSEPAGHQVIVAPSSALVAQPANRPAFLKRVAAALDSAANPRWYLARLVAPGMPSLVPPPLQSLRSAITAEHATDHSSAAFLDRHHMVGQPQSPIRPHSNVNRPDKVLKGRAGTHTGGQANTETGETIGGGDLYLETYQLGRWLKTYVGQQLIRPRSGMMAIDPRSTPPWGGPSLGQ